MTQWRVLAVDDEPINLEIIAEALADCDYQVHRADDGEAAWQLLDGGGQYDVVILDRMMPRLDGLSLLRRIKADSRFRPVPVIMQTAASNPEQVRQGIEAGAYYYLTKPYDPRALQAIVRAAISEIGTHLRGARAEAGIAALGLAVRGVFRFRDLQQAQALSQLLSGICPDPAAVAIGLAELLVNAVEHGNLGIGYREKTLLRLDNRWDEEVARRLAAAQWRDRFVEVSFERGREYVQFTIADEGEGFDASAYLDFDPARACDPNGRGIAMARRMSFCDLEFHGKGNVVVARVRVAG